MSLSTLVSGESDIKPALVGAEWEVHLDTTARLQRIVPVNLDPPGAWTPHGFRKPKQKKFDRAYVLPGAKTIFCDAKTTALASFPCNKINVDQLKALMDVGQNAPAGYIVWFRTKDKVVWFNWQELYRCVTGPDKSLKHTQGLFLGTFHTFRFQPIFDLK